MIWGIKDNERVEATPKGEATCELCQEELIPKCGKIKIWHWAHKSLKECDDWWEPESEWHIKWKNEFPKEQQEVIIPRLGQYGIIDDYNDNGDRISQQKVFFEAPKGLDEDLLKKCITKKHRADIKTNKKIIELQSSSISSEDIESREEFYKDMIWLLHGKKLAKGLQLRPNKGYYTFRWKHPAKTWWVAKQPVYVDTEEGIFLIKKIHSQCPCGGWGYLLSKEEFLKEVKDGAATK